MSTDSKKTSDQRRNKIAPGPKASPPSRNTKSKKKVRGKNDFGSYQDVMLSLVVQTMLDNPDEGHTKIARRMNDQYNINISGDFVGQKWKEARQKHLLKFKASHDAHLSNEIRELLDLDLVEGPFICVLDGATLQSVADEIAKQIRKLIAELDHQDRVHVGFFGGRTNGLIALALAEQLAKEAEKKPNFGGNDKKKSDGRRKEAGPVRGLHFHALVGMLDGGDPEIDPNAFPIYFQKDRRLIEGHLGRRLFFHSFPSPGVVTPDEHTKLVQIGMVRDRIDRRPEYDIIVCSCGHTKCPHTLTTFIEKSIAPYGAPADGGDGAHESRLRGAFEAMERVFLDHGVFGDLAWNPLNEDGPIPIELLPLRVSTILTMNELREIRERGGKTKIIMAAGPCSHADCQKSKHELIKWALDIRLPHFLYVDRKSADNYLTVQRESRKYSKSPPPVSKKSTIRVPVPENGSDSEHGGL